MPTWRRTQFTVERALILALAILLIAGIYYAIPKYRVWSKELAGKALLKEAEWSRQIAVEEARARLESAKLDRQSELERAEGLAEAIHAVKSELSGELGESYLRYRWIEGLHDGSSETIYIPTEGGMPILESTRRLNNVLEAQ